MRVVLTRFVPRLGLFPRHVSRQWKRFPDIENRPGMKPDDGGNLCIGFVGMGCGLGGSLGVAADFFRRVIVSREVCDTCNSVSAFFHENYVNLK